MSGGFGSLGESLDRDTLESEPDPVEWQEWDARRDELIEKYGEEEVFSFMRLKRNLEYASEHLERSAEELYRDTAGEIEARDVQRRLDYDIEKIRSGRGKLLVLNLAETAEISKLEKHSDENSHQWLDKNGWDTRYSYVVADDGLIHKVTMYIAKTADGRNIFYSAKIEKEGVAIDKASVGKLRPAVKVAKPSDHYDTTSSAESQEENSDNIRHSYESDVDEDTKAGDERKFKG